MATVLRSPKSKPAKAKAACPYCGKSHGPWWYAAKQRWMLTSPDSTKANGQRQDILAKGWEGHDDALTEWHKIKSGLAAKVDPHEGTLCGDLFQRHLEELHARIGLSPPIGISAGHYRDADRVLGELASDPVHGIGGWTVGQLRKEGIKRIELWLASKPNWGASTKRGYVSMIISAFRSQEKYIGSNPVQGLKRPNALPRQHVFSAEQVDAILEASFPAFALFFRYLLATGCRPSELCNLTADDVKKDGGKYFLWIDHKNIKRTGGKRRVYLLQPWMQETIADLIRRRPKGQLFLNHIRTPWNENALNAALRGIIADSDKCQALGLDEHDCRHQIKRGKRQPFRVHHYVVYTARHTFAFRMLTGFFKNKDGKPVKKSYAEVAQYMGNSAGMVEKVYGHLVKASQMLGEELTT